MPVCGRCCGALVAGVALCVPGLQVCACLCGCNGCAVAAGVRLVRCVCLYGVLRCGVVCAILLTKSRVYSIL